MDFKSDVGIPKRWFQVFLVFNLDPWGILAHFDTKEKRPYFRTIINTIVLILALLDLIKILTFLAIFWDRGTVTRQVFPGQTLIDVVLKEFRKSLLITEIRCFSFQSLFRVVKLIQKIYHISYTLNWSFKLAHIFWGREARLNFEGHFE